MQLRFVSSWNSITESVADDVISDFVVLSGPNGSGKSNLLEAIANGSVQVDGVAGGVPVGQPIPGVRLFSLAQLAIAAEGAQPHSAFGERWVGLQQNVENIILQHRQPGQPERSPEELETAVVQAVVTNRMITQAALSRMLRLTGKRLTDLTPYDYRTASPLLSGNGVRDGFGLSVGELFLTYYRRRLRNEFLQWRASEKGDETALPLSDEVFLDRYGPAPWTLLDETLGILGLPYSFAPPEGTEDNLAYEPRLHNEEDGATITLGQLSSGEKTLMAVAMTLYSGSRLGDEIEMPRVLLLDEADASLHPSMVKSLLRVVDEIIHQLQGVKVIMTTHSPSTIALAPEESLYTMRRTGRPRLRHVSRDAALTELTVGVPTLSVSNEMRRQVFVESEVDEACYQDLYRILKEQIAGSVSLEFIASGRGGAGNDEAVKHLVTSLRGAGNHLVRGVVDRDARHGAPDGVFFVSGRRSLENLILDPVPLGLLLLRERFVSPEDMSLPEGLRHFEVNEAHASNVLAFVTTCVLGSAALEDVVPITYTNAVQLGMPRAFLEMSGHDLESQLLDVFPALKRYGNELKLTVIRRAIEDVPGFAPLDVITLFESLGDDAR